MAAHEVNVNPIKKWLVHACLRDSQGVNAHESKELPSNAPDSLKEAPNKGILVNSMPAAFEWTLRYSAAGSKQYLGVRKRHAIPLDAQLTSDSNDTFPLISRQTRETRRLSG